MPRSRVFKIAVAVIAVIVLAGGLTVLVRDKKVVKNQDPGQEFTDLKVVQYYLHMPGGDYIIGRKQKSFEKMLKAANKAACSITGSLPLKLDNVSEIELKGISVSVWLLKPQTISTKIKNSSGNKDRYGNKVLVTDRILLVLSGKYQGKIFTRDPQTAKWQGWDSDNSEINGLVEVIRSGGL